MIPALLLAALATAAPVPKVPPPPNPKDSAYVELGFAVFTPAERKRPGPLCLDFLCYRPAVTLESSGPRPAGYWSSEVRLIDVTVTKADGTELTEEEMGKLFTEKVPVVRSGNRLDPKWKKLFAKDLLFIEPHEKPAAN